MSQNEYKMFEFNVCRQYVWYDASNAVCQTAYICGKNYSELCLLFGREKFNQFIY